MCSAKCHLGALMQFLVDYNFEIPDWGFHFAQESPLLD